MCTLILASRMWPELPLLVAANRDEQLDRPSGPPRLWSDRPLPVLAPVDKRAGGTWLGLNAAGLFAGVTNRFGATPPESGRRSRGLLVLDALEERDAPAAAARILGHPGDRHNRFHLLLADRDHAVLVWSDGEHLTREDLAPGLHVLTERSRGAATGGREDLVRQRFAAFGETDPPLEADLFRLLAVHAEDPFDGTCVHAPSLGYGTRSSTVLRLGLGVHEVGYLHSDEPPCQSAGFRDRSAAAAQMLAGDER